MRSYALGDVYGPESAGGLIGYYYRHNAAYLVRDSYARGSVYTSGNISGGFIGYFNGTGDVSGCYSSGNVSGASFVGGFSGNNNVTASGCYWLKDTGTNEGLSSTGSGALSGISEKTDAQLKKRSTFNGWDFGNVWGIQVGQTYPTLQWQGHVWHGGVDNNWSTAGNWNKASVPGALDMVYFNSSSETDSTVDGSFGGSVAGLSVGGLYSGTLTLGKGLSIGCDLYQNSGTIECSSYTIGVGGGISLAAGNFAPGTGTVEAIDVSKVCLIEGGSFNDLTCTTPGKRLSFEAGSLTTVEGTLTLTGTAGNLITLRATPEGTQWRINPAGTWEIDYVDVKDSNNIAVAMINPRNSIGRGNNTNWFETFTITASVIGSNGTIEPYGAVSADEGGSFTSTIRADNGFFIRELKVDDTYLTGTLGALYPYTFEAVSASHTIQASFEAARTWDGGGATNNWSEAANWSHDTLPAADEGVTFDAYSQKGCTIDAEVTVSDFYISGSYNGIITQEADLTVTSDFTQSGKGTFRCNEPQTHAFTAESFSVSENRFTFFRFTGAGTAASPYLIYEVFGLQAMRQYRTESKFFKLDRDIDAGITVNWNSGQGFLRLGTNRGDFRGNLNGNCKVISGLYINTHNTYEGLFGGLEFSTVNDLGLSGGSIKGGDYTGALIGRAEGCQVLNCYSSVNVTSDGWKVGGLIGSCIDRSKIYNSYSTGSVSSSSHDVGGLIGRLDDDPLTVVSNCYAAGAVSGAYDVGGLVGVNDGAAITGSYYDAGTTGQSDTGKGTGRTTEQMKNKYTFTGWDWDSVWGIQGGQTYPTLQWQGHVWYGGADSNWSTAGNWSKASVPGTLDMVYFNSSSETDSTIDGSFGGSIAGLSIGAGYANTVTLGRNLTIGNDLYQNAGVLNCASYTTTISGGISHEAGTFTAGTGTVEMADASRNSTIEGNTTFNDFICSAAGKKITFEAGSITTAEGLFKIKGLAGSPIILRSSPEGTAWKVDPQGTRRVKYVNLKDADNINAEIADAVNSTNAGNNTNWNFRDALSYLITAEVVGANGTIEPYGVVTAEEWEEENKTFVVSSDPGYYIRDIQPDSVPLSGALGSPYAYTFEAISTGHVIFASFEVNGKRVWDGGGVANNWTDQDNWTGNATPEASDTATFDSTSQKVCTIDAAATVANFFISSAYTGIITQEGSLVVTGSFTQEGLGTFECSAPQIHAFTSESFSISDNRGRFLRYTGAGTGGDPYMVYDVYGLQAMKQFLEDAGINFKLANDIDAGVTSAWNAGEGFVPVGNTNRYFKGKFYGQKKSISGLAVIRPGLNGVGLFGYCGGATVYEVYISEGFFSGSTNVGSLVGNSRDSSLVWRCNSDSRVAGVSANIGGLCGYNGLSSSVLQSYSTGNVEGGSTVGGLVGYNSSSSLIYDCYAAGDVSGSEIVGGLAGSSYDSSVVNCYSSGAVSGDAFLGGLIGTNLFDTALTTSSYYDSENSGQSDNTGKGTPKTTTQMKNKYTFTDWDWDNTWGIQNGQAYPTLQWQGHIWYGGAGANWSTAGNWSKSSVPGATDMVYFNASSTTDATVDSSFGGSVAGLSIGAGYANTVTLGRNLTVGNDLYQNAGVLNCASYTTTISGGISHEAGTFTAGTGTVVFNDASRISTIEGNTTFHDLDCSITGKALSFEAGSITTVEGALTLKGSGIGTNRLFLRGTSAGSQWKINPSGTTDVVYVDVMDSNNISAASLNPENSYNSGNNTNWFTRKRWRFITQ